MHHRPDARSLDPLHLVALVQSSPSRSEPLFLFVPRTITNFQPTHHHKNLVTHGRSRQGNQRDVGKARHKCLLGHSKVLHPLTWRHLQVSIPNRGPPRKSSIPSVSRPASRWFLGESDLASRVRVVGGHLGRRPLGSFA